MFERFGADARALVDSAQREARRLGHDWLGTEHLLLGALADPRSEPARRLAPFGLDLARGRDDVLGLVGRSGPDPDALATLGIDLEEVRARAEATFGPGALSGRACREVRFTPRAKQALELALREAQALGDDHLAAVHVVLGVLREGDGVGARVLARHGVERSALLACAGRAG